MKPGDEIFILPDGVRIPWPFGTLVRDDGIMLMVMVYPAYRRKYQLKPDAVNRGGAFEFVKDFNVSRLCDKEGMPLK